MKASLATMVLLAYACAGHAMPIDYDLRSPTAITSTDPIVLTRAGLQLTLSTPTPGAQLYQNGNGLGIKLISGPDGTEIDNIGPDEALLLEFEHEVQVLELVFSQIGLNDAFTLASAHGFVLTAALPGNPADSATARYNATPLTLIGNQFLLSAHGQYSEYSLAGIVVHHGVPEPPAWPLISLGFLGILGGGYTHRRRHVRLLYTPAGTGLN